VRLGERRDEEGGGQGDQAYAPFGAGRETGHQVPVVAAKIKSVRYRESRNTLCHGEKRRKMGRGLSNGHGIFTAQVVAAVRRIEGTRNGVTVLLLYCDRYLTSTLYEY
jgi:hypothetical protein